MDLIHKEIKENEGVKGIFSYAFFVRLAFSILVSFAGVAGCQTPWASRLTLPIQNTIVREQLTIHSDFDLPPHHRLLEELVIQRADLNRHLGLPSSDEPIHVYLFENEESFKGFMKLYHPDFPDRRAFFTETDTKLSVYAHWGDHVAEDLRHEITHGYLHSTVPNLPLWFDEGLAEFYEAPRSDRRLNRGNLKLLVERIRREHWQPDLKRLESLDPTKDMSQNDYAEAWAWIHFMLETRPEYADSVRAYISDLRHDGAAIGFYERLTAVLPDPNAALEEYLKNL
jgi:hypothetical protein